MKKNNYLLPQTQKHHVCYYLLPQVQKHHVCCKKMPHLDVQE
jgi:hypothetical protein